MEDPKFAADAYREWQDRQDAARIARQRTTEQPTGNRQTRRAATRRARRRGKGYTR